MGKNCAGCGVEVSGQKRFKDEVGRYFCAACWGKQIAIGGGAGSAVTGGVKGEGEGAQGGGVLRAEEGINAGTMKCPFCAEVIRAEAKKCRFCGEHLVEKASRAAGSTGAWRWKVLGGVVAAGVLVVVLIVVVAGGGSRGKGTETAAGRSEEGLTVRQAATAPVAAVSKEAGEQEETAAQRAADFGRGVERNVASRPAVEVAGGLSAAPAPTVSRPLEQKSSEQQSVQPAVGKATSQGPIPLMDLTSDEALRIVIWNTHNWNYKDRGTEICNVILYRGEEAVWSKEDIDVPWKEDECPSVEVSAPLVAFDRVRIEITKCHKWSAGLSEVEVFVKGQNVARKWEATGDGNRLPASNVIDGIHDDPANAKGYWVNDQTTGWIELRVPKGK